MGNRVVSNTLGQNLSVAFWVSESPGGVRQEFALAVDIYNGPDTLMSSLNPIIRKACATTRQCTLERKDEG